MVRNKGPVVVVLQVTKKFEFYKSGIFFDEECSTDKKKSNHAVSFKIFLKRNYKFVF
jgi:hypothetical protein